MKATIGLLPEQFQTEYYAIPENKPNGIYDRIAVVNKAFAHVLEKGSGDDVKQVTEKYRKLEKDLRDQNAALQASLEAEKKNAAETITKEKLNYVLRSKVQEFVPKLDQNLFKLDAQKNFLIDSTINDLFAGFTLEFDSNNPSTVNLLNKDRTDVYEGNTKVSLDKKLEKMMEPYTVKNNGGKTQETTSTKPTVKQIDTQAPQGKDLKAKMIAAAQ
jgi:hypothetical protein